MKIFKSVMNILAAIEKGLIGVLLLIEVTLTFGNVLSRYVLHKGWSFTEELVVALLVLMSVVGAALSVRDSGGLVSLSLFTDRMPKKLRLVIEILMMLLSMVFAGAMLYYGVRRCMTQIALNRTTTVLRFPEWYYSSFIPIGGALLLLHFAERIIDDLHEISHSEDSKAGTGL